MYWRKGYYTLKWDKGTKTYTTVYRDMWIRVYTKEYLTNLRNQHLGESTMQDYADHDKARPLYEEDCKHFSEPWLLWECTITGLDEWTACKHPIHWNRFLTYRRCKDIHPNFQLTKKDSTMKKITKKICTHVEVKGPGPGHALIIPSGEKDRYHVIQEDPEKGSWYYEHTNLHANAVRVLYGVEEGEETWIL